MPFKDYNASPGENTTLGDGIYIGPNMARDDVRPALQQLAADGFMLAKDMENAGDKAVATVEALIGPTYSSIAAGLAATANGDSFAVRNADETVTIYLDSNGTAIPQRTLATTALLERNFGKVPAIANNPNSNEAPAINAAFQNSDVSRIVLPPWAIGIGAGIKIPAGKTLEGAGRGRTVLTALPSFRASAPRNPAMIDGPGNGDTCTVRGITLDGKERGIGGTTDDRCHGFRLLWTRNFLIEDCEATGLTGYAFWAVGGDNDVATKWSSGTFRHCYAENSQVCFEQTACDGVLVEDCHARKSSGNVGALSFFHPLTGSRNITYRDCSGIGAAATGFDPQADKALGRLLADNLYILTTGATTALSVAPDQPGTIEMLTVRNSRFICPLGIGASILKAEFDIAGTTIEGHTAVYLDGAGGGFDNCAISAATEPSGGVAAVGLSINSLRDAADPIRLTGRTRFAVTGPAGSTPILQPNRVWVGPDCENARGEWNGLVGMTNVAGTTLVAAGGYFTASKTGGADGAFDAVCASGPLAGDFMFEIISNSLINLRVGMTKTQNPAEFTTDQVVGFVLSSVGGIAERTTETPLGGYGPGEHFWMRRFGNVIELRRGGSSFERGNLVFSATQSGPLYFNAQISKTGASFTGRGLAA